MEKQLFDLLINLVSGLCGGLFTYLVLKKREIIYSKIIDNKIKIYSLSSYFLRNLAGMNLGDATLLANKLADELIFWAPDSVYLKTKNIILKLANDPSLSGVNFENDICSIILEMVKDIRKDTKLTQKDIIPKLTLE